MTAYQRAIGLIASKNALPAVACRLCSSKTFDLDSGLYTFPGADGTSAGATEHRPPRDQRGPMLAAAAQPRRPYRSRAPRRTYSVRLLHVRRSKVRFEFARLLHRKRPAWNGPAT